MRKQFTLRLFAAAAIFVLLLSVQTTNAQQSTTNAAASKATAALSTVATGHAASAVAEEDEKAPSAKQGSEGIKVHGHWVLEVKNPDGKLVERREFNNSLVTGGASLSGDQILAALLSGNASAGGFGIAFIAGPAATAGIDTSSFCNAPAPGSLTPPQPAGIQCFGLIGSTNEAIVMSQNQNQFLNSPQTGLITTMSYSPNVNIVLSGNFMVSPSYSITSISAVQTYTALCTRPNNGINYVKPTGSGYSAQGSDIPSAYCTALGMQTAITDLHGGPDVVLAGALTSTVIPNGPLAIAPNQIITVTVTLSFS